MNPALRKAPANSSAVRSCSQELLQSADLHGLDEMSVEARLDRALHVFPRPVAAHRHNKWPAVSRIAAQRSRHVITVHPRKADIEQDDLGAIFTGDAQRFGTG